MFDKKTIKENKDKIDQLKSIVIDQLKNSSWRKEGSGFKNKHFTFEYSSHGWRFKAHFGSTYDTSGYIHVDEIMSLLHFNILRKIFVNRSIKNYEKLEREYVIANQAEKFFSKNVDVVRDNKLNKILDK